MSVDLIVYLPRAAMPTPARWAQAIRDAGFAVDLDSDFDPDTASGFRPCKFRGVPSGFEYYRSRLSEQERQPAGCDFSVTLVTHSNLREFATSLIAVSVLCEISGGMLYDPQAGESHPASGVVAWARERLASFEEELQ